MALISSLGLGPTTMDGWWCRSGPNWSANRSRDARVRFAMPTVCCMLRSPMRLAQNLAMELESIIRQIRSYPYGRVIREIPTGSLAREENRRVWPLNSDEVVKKKKHPAKAGEQKNGGNERTRMMPQVLPS